MYGLLMHRDVHYATGWAGKGGVCGSVNTFGSATSALNNLRPLVALGPCLSTPPPSGGLVVASSLDLYATPLISHVHGARTPASDGNQP